MKTSKIIYLLLLPLLISSCAIIRPGEVGLKQKLGKLSEDVYKQGTVLYNPIITKVIRTNVQINNIELSLSLPSKEVLSIVAQISILYRVDENSVQKLFETWDKDMKLSYQTSFALHRQIFVLNTLLKTCTLV